MKAIRSMAHLVELTIKEYIEDHGKEQKEEFFSVEL